MNHRQPSEQHDKNDKTYIWAKLHNGTFIPDDKSLAGKNNNNSTKRKRGAPSDDIWGWTPGYYTYDGSNIINTTSADEKKVGEVQYKFILLGLDNLASSSDDDGQHLEHILSEEITNQLLQSGDVVLANAWEEYDFVNRLELNNADDNDDDESEYNYDQDSGTDDDDDERGASFKLNILDEDKVDDCPPSNLIELTHLHEPSVVHALRHRYENIESDNQHCNIYTDTGPILLAVNPFKSDESGLLYGETTVQKYRVEGEKCWLKERREMMGGGGGSGNITSSDDMKEVDEIPPPHVYAVADRTFRTMMTRVHDISASATSTAATSKAKSSMPTQPDTTGDPKINQSVLVSGESGAGKTVTTKLLMAYLSKLSENPDSASTSNDNEKEVMSIEKRVLKSNPIMESFGNARTIRNDNSSRFGKYIEMKFLSSVEKSNNIDHMPRATLVGASVETYLLEKVRLVHQSPGERNYHIFYEVFCIKDEDIENQSAAEKLGLLDYEMEDFRLINQSDTYDRRDGVPDSETFSDLQSAMSIMGFTPDEINAVFQVTTALLHTSNLSFERIDEIECALIQDNAHLDYVVDLLGITKEALNSALCYYEITIGGNGGETHKRVLSMEQCEKGVEALIKATYGALFNYLVKRINMSVAGDKEGNASNARKSGQKEASIGILDIFGFESFQVNSFEQLCINYCNEALQQQFNRFVLRNEQEEYDKEGITWTFIEFPENQDVLDLIDLKGTGILNMLHDQCRTPGASDKTFALAMYEKCSTHNRFEADRRQVAEQLFAIQHYAGLVEYDIKGFVEKNRDELPKSGSDLLLSSNKAFVKTLAELLQSNSTTNDTKKMMSPRNGKAKRPTVGIQFSTQLHSLRRKIDDTSPHYIRCLKPNNLLLPNHFNAALIADQLRCAGVIEAVRVSRLGYPQRFSHNQFISRYRILGRKLKKKSNTSKKYNPAKALVHSIIQRLPNQQTADDVGIQVGKTKVFLRRQAYDLLEQLRRVRAADAAIIIQNIARGYVCRKLFVKTQHSLITLQCFVRRILADRVVAAIRQHHNSLTIQRSFRAYLARKRYISAKTIAWWCQTHHRGNVGRQAYNALNREQNALYIQSRWRGYLARRSFRRKMRAALTIQCARRCQTARTELRALKNAARDLTAVVEERDRLRHEAATLRNELQKMKEVSHVEQFQHVVAGHSSGSTEKETEIISLRTALNQLAMEKETADKELEKVTKMLAFVSSERDEAIQDRDDSRAVNKLLQTELNTREDELHSIKKEKSKGSSESQNAKIISTDTTQVLDLKSELKELREAYSNLQRANDQLKNENVSKRTTHIGERSPGVVPATTVCTSLTDMDMTEDTELARLREENGILQKQLELLRVNNEFQDIPDDQEYDESVAPTGSTVTEHIGDANVMPESVMQQICNEVETCTEQVIVKTRKESEANIAKLQAEIDEFKRDTERSKRLAKYDLDDMKRVNNSLRQDLEALEAEKVAIEEDLTLQIEEFDTLNEDVEQFAETFATQHEELEKAESLVKKLQSDNKNLKALDEEKTKMIEELKSQFEDTSPTKQEWVGTEIERLWSEIGRLRETPASAEPIKDKRPSPDDTSSDEEETKEESIEGSST